MSGVRRSGKTTLSRIFSGALYLNCNLPSVHRQLEEPESLYSSLSQLSGLSRPTVKSHVGALSIAHAVFLLPPFHGGGRREIVRRPKCYAFDTGFITFVRGWDSIREDDRGILWEHLVLDYLRAGLDPGKLYFWRDKSDREVDFVIRRPRETVDVVECKISPDGLDVASLQSFRTIYPKGMNYVVSPLVKMPYARERGISRKEACRHLVLSRKQPATQSAEKS